MALQRGWALTAACIPPAGTSRRVPDMVTSLTPVDTCLNGGDFWLPTPQQRQRRAATWDGRRRIKPLPSNEPRSVPRCTSEAFNVWPTALWAGTRWPGQRAAGADLDALYSASLRLYLGLSPHQHFLWSSDLRRWHSLRFRRAGTVPHWVGGGELLSNLAG